MSAHESVIIPKIEDPRVVARKELPANVLRLGWILTVVGLALVVLSYMTDSTRAACPSRSISRGR